MYDVSPRVAIVVPIRYNGFYTPPPPPIAPRVLPKPILKKRSQPVEVAIEDDEDYFLRRMLEG